MRRWFGLLLFAASLIARPVLGQISPGPLARAHAKLEGPANCVQCHGLRKEPMTQRCLACHKEVAWLIQQERGVHAPSRNTGRKECAQCHPDHAGVDFNLIDWGKGGQAQFDHARTGWALDGKHRDAKCSACHQPALRHGNAASLSPRTTGAGWMGLDVTCASCHERDDVHRNALGRSCDRCHDAADWRKATKFEHASSSYPLTGKHADVACDKCHKAARLNLRPEANGRIIGLYKPLPSADCASCHADPHKGRLTAKCNTCHSTRDFRAVERKDFDHGATRYPLTGKHALVACDACHGANLSKRTPAYATCGSCHADAHLGRGTLAGRAVDCAACHRVDGFRPSTYTVAQHAATSFALAGRHTDTRCALCHVVVDSSISPATRHVARRVTLHPRAQACGDCHADAHRADVLRTVANSACQQCHDERSWSATSFGAVRHAALALPLDGAHQPVPCERCHEPQRPSAQALPNGRRATGTVPLRLDAACGSCHVDPHLGRFERGGAHPTTDGCRTCHDARRFAPARLSAAQHAALGFTLDGAHAAVACAACHRDLGVVMASRTLKRANPAPAPSRLAFGGAARTGCLVCHADPHGGQFMSSKRGGACERCHDTARWTGATSFVHDRDTSFPLAGAHSRVPCAACHKAEAQSGGGTRVQYRSLPTACEGCHADANARKRP